MAIDVGSLYPTKIPSLSENADIQEALRLYHYGAASTVYNPANTNTTNLVPQSIAYYLNNLQTQITNVSGSLGVQASAWTAKGVLLTATAASATSALTVGANGTVLTANSATATGLQWSVPEVLADNSVTLTNKTLTAPRFGSSGYIADSSGLPLISFPATVTSPVNAITISNAATGNKPSISATGSDTNITLNLISKGTGTVQINGSDVPTLTGIQTFTNKTLSNPTITNDLYLASVSGTGSKIVFEGNTDDAFETVLGVVEPTVDRTINFPDVDGTVITTGNLSSITTVGNVTSGTWNASSIGATKGGTGLSTYATGDIIYASATNTLSNRTIGTEGQLLTVVSGIPQWTNAPVTLPSQTGNTNKFLTTNGTTASWGVATIGTTQILANNTYTTLPGVTSINGATLPSSGTIPNTSQTFYIGTQAITISQATGTVTALAGVTSVNGTSIPASSGTALVTTSASQTVSGNLIYHIATNAQTGTTYTVVASDDGKIIEMNNASANTITVPNLSTLPVGTQINILQTGAGQTTIAAGTNVVINATPGLKLRAQWSSGTLIKRVSAVAPSNDIWVLIGDLIA